MDDMNIGTRGPGAAQNQWKSYSLQRGTAPIATEVSPPQIPPQPPGGQNSNQNAIYATTNYENADGTLVIRRQMLSR